MADHSKPVLTSTYTNFVSELNGRFNDIALGLASDTTTPTNTPTNAIRYNATNKNWERWSGTAWAVLDAGAGYGISITGSAAKWTTARTITLGTDLSGSVSIDGSSNVTLNATYSTVPANKGGTGQTTYAVGDILYASTTTALSRLADVATGNVLISGGVGIAPSWGTVGLTTHVSGTLAVANGGTGGTTYTSGGLLRGNGTSAITVASASDIVTAIGSTAVTNATNAGSATSAGKSTNLVGSSVGSIPYQSAADTTSFIADVAVGSALISGGVGAAPSWGSIGLTTHVSGTLPIANGGTGGTTVISALQSLGVITSNTAAKSAAYTVVGADRGIVLYVSGTWTLTLTAAATLGNGFSIGVINTGTGTITIDPNLTETVDGLTTKALTPGQSCILICDGSSWRTLGLSGGGAKGGGADDIFYENSQTITTDYTLTTGKNAMSAGPITLNTGITVTVPTGATWTVV